MKISSHWSDKSFMWDDP